jgi:hypothetical protein
LRQLAVAAHAVGDHEREAVPGGLAVELESVDRTAAMAVPAVPPGRTTAILRDPRPSALASVAALDTGSARVIMGARNPGSERPEIRDGATGSDWGNVKAVRKALDVLERIAAGEVTTARDVVTRLRVPRSTSISSWSSAPAGGS